MSDKLDQVCELLADKMAELRKRRDAFERMGSDDAARLIESELDLLRTLSDAILKIVASR